MPDNYGYNPNQYPGNNNNKKSGIPTWAIIVCFCCGLWPVGLVLLVLRLGQESGAFSSRRGRDTYDYYASQASRFAREARDSVEDAARTIRNDARAYRDQQQSRAWQAKQQAQQQAQQARQQAQQAWQQTQQQARQQAQQRQGQPQSQAGQPQQSGQRQTSFQQKMKKVKSGKLFSILGGSIMGVFGFATLMTFFENFTYLFYRPMWMLQEVLPLFVLTGIGAGMFTWGRFKKSQSKRFRRYLSLIGEQKQVSISALAAAYPAKRDACRTTLENMIEAGIFGDGAYLDYGRDLLVLDGSGVRPEEPPRRKATAPETDIGEENALLRQIREVNDAIRHPELSRKIDRIGEITERILEFQKEHPEKSAELRKFLNYYLPTTLKILNSYAELEKQGIEGENIAATKQRIESMMDMVVEGFERQLDKLFAGDMMDIAADITVMEQMMQGDGLFDGQGPGNGLGGH